MAQSRNARATGTDNGNRRQRILDIATEEFATKGLAGTRVDVIAQKARCNKQLIYYYFKSKENLYDEVLGSMMAQTRAETPPSPEAPARLTELLRRPSDKSRNARRWRRLLMWEALDAKKGKIVREPERTLVWRRRVDELRHLQEQGELDADFDTEMLAVVSYAVQLFPTMLPQIAKMTSGLDPESPEFSDRYEAMLTTLETKLAPTSPKKSGRRPTKVPAAR
jgi:AcrR family transcriptional regulator